MYSLRRGCSRRREGGGTAIGAADEVCRAAAAAIEVDGAALTAVTDHGERATLASTGVFSTWITELQHTTVTGPCLDAYTRHRPVSGSDLSSTANQQRWPGFATAALEAGVWAVFAFPLLVGAHCGGTLMLYRHRLGRLTLPEFRDGIGMAEAGLWALLDSRAGIDADQPLPPLGAGQDQVQQAAGMVSVQLRVGIDEALVRLRAHAWAHDQALSDIARAVITRRLRLAAAPAAD